MPAAPEDTAPDVARRRLSERASCRRPVGKGEQGLHANGLRHQCQGRAGAVAGVQALTNIRQSHAVALTARATRTGKPQAIVLDPDVEPAIDDARANAYPAPLDLGFQPMLDGV